MQTTTDGKIESLVVTSGSGYTDGTYYVLSLVMEQIREQVLVHVRITVSSGAIVFLD